MPPKITFITRHYPPNPNINGESVSDMVEYFEKHYNISSNVICINRGFEGGGIRNKKGGGRVFRLRTPYQGKSPLLRFVAFLYDGYILARRALKFKNTLLVCTTSPPLLPLWASLYFKKNVHWALWAFDLFPEGFGATGQIKKSDRLYRWALKQTYKGRPAFIIALGPKQAAYLQKQYHSSIPAFILPCGILSYQEKSEAVPDWRREDKIYLGYCGNVGDPHNPELIRSVIDHLDPEKHCLILALYGNKADEVKAFAAGKPGVILVERVPREQLHFIDIHLVTLRTEWTHIAVPSKAVSAVSLGCTILFCGSPESDNWRLLQKAAWFIPEESIGPEVKMFLKTLNRQDIDHKKAEALMLNGTLRQDFLHSYQAIAKMADPAIEI